MQYSVNSAVNSLTKLFNSACINNCLLKFSGEYWNSSPLDWLSLHSGVDCQTSASTQVNHLIKSGIYKYYRIFRANLINIYEEKIKIVWIFLVIHTKHDTLCRKPIIHFDYWVFYHNMHRLHFLSWFLWCFHTKSQQIHTEENFYNQDE